MKNKHLKFASNFLLFVFWYKGDLFNLWRHTDRPNKFLRNNAPSPLLTGLMSGGVQAYTCS